ncbi:MAG: VanZ family protein [Rubrivivax sp.]
MQAPADDPALSARQRRQLGWLLLAWALFIVYGSWVPLNFRPGDWAQAWSALWQWPAGEALRQQRLDTAVNALLTVPLSFGLALLWAPPRARAPWLARVAIVLLVLALSLLVEVVQAFLPGRSESLGDVAAQTAGSLLGLVLQAAWGRRAQRYLAGLAAAHDRQSRALHLLQAYLLAMLLFAVMPLDLTLDLGELYGKWRDGRVRLLPFSPHAAALSEQVYDWASDVLLWLPVGALWRQGVPGRTTAAIVGRALLLAAAIELTQWLVLSRFTDSTDVVLAGIGAGLGAAVVPPVLRRLALDRGRWRRACLAGLAVWLAVTVLIYAWPFDWRWPAAGWAAFGEAFGGIPFLTYFQRNEFGALNEILRKLLVFLPGGALLRLVLAAGGQRRPSRGWLLLLAALAGLLEALQVLLADRVADLTDALLATAGAVAGWRLAGWLQSLEAGLPAPPAGRDAGPPARPQPSPPPHSPRPTQPPSRAAWLPHLAMVLALAALLGVAARLPGMPYNVAKLIPAGAAGWLSALGLALAAWWAAALPVAAAVLAPGRLALALPLWLLLHGLLSFAALRLMVPLPMLHKVIGSPVLAWPGPLEDLARYLALHLALLLPLCCGAALVQALRSPQALARWLNTLMLAALLAWPLHWAVVEQAATDNLAELMRGGGSLAASAWLALAVAAAGACAGALACLAVDRHRRGLMLGLALAAAAVATGALVAGLEPLLIKYGKAFSALQFILSAGRDAYATGTELAARYLAAFGALVGGLACLQAPWWRRAAARRARGRARPLSGNT